MNQRLTPLILGLLFTLFLSQGTRAQDALTAGYFSNVGIQPGAQLGLVFDLKEVSERNRVLFLSPQIASFTRPGVNTNYLLRVEGGIRQNSQSGKSFSALSGSLGYLLRSELLSLSVNLGSGDIEDKTRESSHHFVPTIHYTYGRYLNEKWSWLSKAGLGYRFETDDQGSAMVFIEAGIYLKLIGNN